MSNGSIHPVIVGTAGHVDHGKSSLVRRLTGIDPDRLAEEKARGLTIDLGFAPFHLDDGRLVGMVDVPGHERFLKNMVAGASSVDLALLVIAADDAVMPQTREHLDVLELLGVTRGIVALTKIDLVDEETRMMAEEDVKELLAGRSIAGAPILGVSSITGEGIDELRRVLQDLVQGLTPRGTEGVFRMPVQRVFSIQGFGTVVTGIPLAGEIAVGDHVEIVGKGIRSRIRGIHAYGEAVERARAGHSTALNLPDVPVADARRGDVVAVPGRVATRDRIEMELRVVDGVSRLKHGESMHLHVGTSELNARVFLLDKADLHAGQVGLAQVLCEEQFVALPGDFALLRRLSPSRTVAGGRVIGIGGRRLRRFREVTLERLRAKEAALNDPSARLEITVGEVGEVGIDASECASRLGWEPIEFDSVLFPLLEADRICRERKSGRLFSRASVEREEQRVRRAMQTYFDEHPMSSTCPIGHVRRGTGAELLAVALERIEAQGDAKVLPGGMLQDSSREQTVSPEERAKLDAVASWLDSAGARAHTRDELMQQFGAEGGKLLERLLEDTDAVAVGPLFVWGGKTFRQAVDHVTEVCAANDGALVIPSLRDRLGTSRKFLIPFLEHLDRIGVTARKGDRRILRRR